MYHTSSYLLAYIYLPVDLCCGSQRSCDLVSDVCSLTKFDEILIDSCDLELATKARKVFAVPEEGLRPSP